MAFNANQQARLLESQKFDPIESLRKSVAHKGPPWESIIDFATHRSFCGKRLYPRQHTLLKLMFLETEHMTAYDLDVIEEWRQNFLRRRDAFGVQPDIWYRIKYLKKRGARRFPHIQFVGGRRGSKGLMGGILGAEQIAYMFSLEDWQAHYGIDPGKDGYLQVGATSLTQAKAMLFADVRNTIEGCAYLQPHIAESKDHAIAIRTPGDVRRIAEMKAQGVPIEHMIATLRAQPLSASGAAGRGATSFCIMLDEFAFMVQTGSQKSDSAVYEDWAPSLDQFDLDALMYVPSSPWVKTGKFYELYQEGSVLMQDYVDREGIGEEAREQLKALRGGDDDEVDVVANPTMLIIHLPSWGLYLDWERGPELVGVRFKRPIQPGPDHETQVRRRLRNPERFAVERAAQWAEVQGAYFDPDVVDRMFESPGWRPPLEAQSRGYLRHRYRIHCDPGRTGANFALCIGHLEDAPPDDNGKVWPHVIIDLLHVWRPGDFPPDEETGKPTIDYVQVQQDIEDILRRFPSTTKISFDQWNSAPLLAQLRREFSPSIRVTEVTFTEKENQARFERVKGALNLGWVHSYRDTFFGDGASLLEMELKFLAEKNGKVVKQDFGPVTTKDLCDAFCVVVSDLLHDALERHSGEDMTRGAYGSTNVAGLRSGRDLERSGGEVSQARQALAEWGRSARQQLRGGVYNPAGSIHRRALQRGALSPIHR